MNLKAITLFYGYCMRSLKFKKKIFFFFLSKLWFRLVGSNTIMFRTFFLQNDRELEQYFFFLRKPKTQIYATLCFNFIPKIFLTNGIINSLLKSKKKSVKKSDRVSSILVKNFSLKLKDYLEKGTRLSIFFMFIKKVFHKTMKVLNKEKLEKFFKISYFFFLKNLIQITKQKKKDL